MSIEFLGVFSSRAAFSERVSFRVWLLKTKEINFIYVDKKKVSCELLLKMALRSTSYLYNIHLYNVLVHIVIVFD